MKHTFHPERFQGAGKKRNYFEGWYFKHVFPNAGYAFAVIPGISLGDGGSSIAADHAAGPKHAGDGGDTPAGAGPTDGHHTGDGARSHAFVQFFDSSGGPFLYERYPLHDFYFEKKRFEVQIGGNRFSLNGITLDLPRAGIKGEFTYDGITPWPVSLFSPGAMGWYAYVPVMEDYHGVLSFDHAAEGYLQLSSTDPEVNMSECIVVEGRGQGYIEKDWGTSFPSSWIWMQTNHFDEKGTSLTLSAAVIPWMGRSFSGFITGLWYNNRLYRFCTYNRTRITELTYISDSSVRIIFENHHHRLVVEGTKIGSTRLKAPAQGAMESHVDESLNSHIHVDLKRKRGGLSVPVFSGEGKYAGLEIHGRIHR